MTLLEAMNLATRTTLLRPIFASLLLLCLGALSQPSIAAEMLTPGIDHEIANALDGLSTPEDLDHAVRIFQTAPIPKKIFDNPIFQNSYKKTRRSLIDNKRKLWSIASRLYSADWRNPETIKLAAQLKIALDKFHQKNLFDRSATQKINASYLRRTTGATNYPPDDGLIYLDVDKNSIHAKPTILVYDTSGHSFQEIDNPFKPQPQPTTRPSFGTDERNLVSLSHQTDEQTSELPTGTDLPANETWPRNESTESSHEGLPLRNEAGITRLVAHVYLPASHLQITGLTDEIVQLATKLHARNDGSRLAIVAKRHVANKLRTPLKLSFPGQLLPHYVGYQPITTAVRAGVTLYFDTKPKYQLIDNCKESSHPRISFKDCFHLIAGIF